ncbi:ABC transporter transmembrane domain-containing protein [Nisaea acidiphila]|uniref:ABC transporter transmembrane domain-containing protein n=1 Tax=Nisaea acidiphila TaxID=1862145 RepID=A0A9J7AY64_9PROT|nr:ABC transporter transmembrane domain-containing protein [Nisaea acidiphila]UUX51738.1 ABC transporter transmembrane domain-containing protein [Nisaea acidiphila]
MSEENSRRNLGPLRALMPFVAPYRLQIAGAMVALVVAAVTVLAMGNGLRHLVDNGFSAGDPELLDQAVIVLLGVVILLAGASYARFYLVSWIGERVVADIRKAVFNHVISLSPGYFETMRTGELLSRIATDTTLVQTVVGSSVSIALRNTLLFLGAMVMLLFTSAKLTGYVFLVVPIVVVPIIVFGRKVRKLSRETQDRVADLGSYAEETLYGIRAVQAFAHEPVDRANFGDRVEDALFTALRRIRARAALTAIVITLVFGSVAVILWIGGKDVLAGRISAGELSAFVFYAAVVAGSTGALSEVIGDLQRAAGAMERLMDLLKAESEVSVPANPVALPSPAKGLVSFENVGFRYPARPDVPSLSGMTASVKPGERVAIVGPSGAGKSTIFQLLLRFYDPQDGRVTIDGVDLRDADPVAFRSLIGLVPQEPVIFSDNALENIRYGRPDASDEEVRAAAEAANAKGFIEALPDGFATHLGEKGVRLSGGQRQRIAIARAILRDPAILLLDEATSALDAESERAVQKALEAIMPGRTTLVIAHRLATVLKADRILVLEEGRLVAEGRHAELLETSPLYRHLADLQFADSAAAGLAISAE